MEDILLSQRQYNALLERLYVINKDVTSIKLMSGPETRYFDNWDLLQLLQVSTRTVQRWRKNGQLPYTKIGKKYYYNAETILESFKIKPDDPAEEAHSPPEMHDLEEAIQQVNCHNCPLFKIMMS